MTLKGEGNMSFGGKKLVRATGLEDYFRCELRTAISHQKVETSPHTEFYLVRILSDFCHSTALYASDKNKEVPLAIQYLESLQANQNQAFRLLKQLGDFALYIAGFFQDSLHRKNVDLDYYISMGGNAYHRLHSITRNTSLSQAIVETFLELAANFTQYVDVLSEVSENSKLWNDSDLLRLYEKWLNTGSERLKKKLNDHGIYPHLFPKQETTH
jgi:hypothetical protein